jgi:hypothetical protein
MMSPVDTNVGAYQPEALSLYFPLKPLLFKLFFASLQEDRGWWFPFGPGLPRCVPLGRRESAR